MSPNMNNETEGDETTPALVPNLRFPEFRGTAGWQSGPIDAICRIYQSETISSSAFVADGPYLVYGANGAVGRLDRFNHENEEVVISCRGNCGEVHLTKPQSWITGNAMVVSPKNIQISKRYLFEVLRASNLDRVISGSAQPQITRAGLAPFRLPVPSIPEQQRIADCLGSLDELVAVQERKVEALKAHKKGLMQQLFPQEGETQPRVRFPEFQDAEEWNLTTVGELVEAGFLFAPKDGNHGNIHPKSSDYVAKGIPFIMASDLDGGLIDIENCHFIRKEQADTLQKGFAKEGDVLLSHKGTVGEVAVVRKINTPYLMLTPQVTYYRVKDRNNLLNDFLAQLFVSDQFKSNLVEVSGGGTRAYIGITEQAKLRLQLPIDVEEQQRIADCLTGLDDLITAESTKLSALKTHKKGLMQQLFPTPAED
jgi:type I restriction enzyme S subunit